MKCTGRGIGYDSLLVARKGIWKARRCGRRDWVKVLFNDERLDRSKSIRGVQSGSQRRWAEAEEGTKEKSLLLLIVLRRRRTESAIFLKGEIQKKGGGLPAGKEDRESLGAWTAEDGGTGGNLFS